MEVPPANIGNLVSGVGGELELSALRFCGFLVNRRNIVGGNTASHLQILSIALEAHEQLVGNSVS